MVLDAIQGPDERDLAVQNVPFNWDPSLDVRRLRIGYLKAAFNDTKQTAYDANDAAAQAIAIARPLTRRDRPARTHTYRPASRVMRRSERGAR